MFKPANFRLSGFFSLLLLLGAQASAQFEVSPDHFDTPPATKKAAQRTGAKSQASKPVSGHTTKSVTRTAAATQKITQQKRAQRRSAQQNRTVVSVSRPVTAPN